MTLLISGKEYKVEYGYNNFCDSDLLENAEEMMKLLSGAESDADVSVMGKMKELFIVVRELLFEGFKEHNPVDTLQDVGRLLDTYRKETPKPKEGEEPETRGLFELFLMITHELVDEGFLGDLMAKMIAAVEDANANKSTVIPMDHKKPQKKGSKK